MGSKLKAVGHCERRIVEEIELVRKGMIFFWSSLQIPDSEQQNVFFPWIFLLFSFFKLAVWLVGWLVELVIDSS